MKIEIHKTFKDANDADYKSAAGRTSLESLAIAKELIERIYSRQIAENKLKPRNNRIKIITREKFNNNE